MGLLRALVRRSLLAWHRPRHWRLRPGTLDGRIFREVVIGNEYRLPKRFGPGDVVVDVGGHVGSFALAALRRGAGKVVVCEPAPANFAVLRQNLAPFAGRVDLRAVAVWGGDVPADGLRLADPIDPRNTGAGRTSTGPGVAVAVVAFDDLIDAVGGEVRLLKLDCEGAEWPILATARRLDRVAAVCGEYHLDAAPPRTPASTAVLEADLARAGFRVEVVPHPAAPDRVGLFFATR